MAVYEPRKGFVMLNRDLFETELFQKCTLKQKWIYLTILHIVNFEQNHTNINGKKIKLLPGQSAYSYQTIANLCGHNITKSQVRSALKKFQKYDHMTVEPVPFRTTMITIRDWDVYFG